MKTIYTYICVYIYARREFHSLWHNIVLERGEFRCCWCCGFCEDQRRSFLVAVASVSANIKFVSSKQPFVVELWTGVIQPEKDITRSKCSCYESPPHSIMKVSYWYFFKNYDEVYISHKLIVRVVMNSARCDRNFGELWDAKDALKMKF